MSDTTETTTSTETAKPTETADPIATMRAEIAELREAQKSTRESLLADVRRLRHKLKAVGGDDAPEDKGAKGAEGSVSNGPDELKAAMRLGELRASLSAEARADLDALEGASFAEQLRIAEMLGKYAVTATTSSGSGDQKPKLPAGTAASASQLHAPKPEPKSLRELYALQKTDPEHFKALMANDSSFDPSRLR